MEPQSSPQENVDAKATFRKPLNDSGNRIYRRRSPVGGSSSSEGKIFIIIFYFFAFDFVTSFLTFLEY